MRDWDNALGVVTIGQHARPRNEIIGRDEHNIVNEIQDSLVKSAEMHASRTR
jgi:hypothetical protein